MNIQDVKRMAFASERAPRTMHFVIPGIPIPLARPRFSGGHVWDSQKPQKLIIGLMLADQLGSLPLFSGALEVAFTFYFPMPKRLSAKHNLEMRGTPHKIRPDCDNIIKLYLDCSNGILFKDDCMVVTLHAKKVYDDGNSPRTEMIITELF